MTRDRRGDGHDERRKQHRKRDRSDAGPHRPRERTLESAALLRELAGRIAVAAALDGGAGDALLRSITEAAVALFEAEASSIALFDPATGRLVFRVAAGAQGDGIVGVSIAPEEGIAGYVYATGQAMAIGDVQADPRFGRSVAEQSGYVPRSMVAVPLVDGEQTVGVLEVMDRRDGGAFSLRDVELAGTFAGQAAAAIRASRVERDGAVLLGRMLSAVAAGDAEARTVTRLMAEASAALDADEPFWTIVDRLARLRNADPEDLDLALAVLDAVVAHSERRRGRRRHGHGNRPDR